MNAARIKSIMHGAVPINHRCINSYHIFRGFSPFCGDFFCTLFGGKYVYFKYSFTVGKHHVLAIQGIERQRERVGKDTLVCLCVCLSFVFIFVSSHPPPPNGAE